MQFSEIYEQHKDLVYNLALQYVQNIEDAQEITQDVFMSVHQAFERFNYNSKISTWIYRITINRSLDHIKAKKRKKRFAFITNLFGENVNEVKFDRPSFDHPGVQLEQKEDLEKIFGFMNELPDRQKTALILSKIEHKLTNEIAEIMNLSNRAVESLIQRAKANLSKKIDESEGNHN